MKKLLILFCSLLIISSTLINCNPPDSCIDCPDLNLPKVPKDTIYFPKEFLNYTYFNQGSWWIYQRIDTNALIYDTVRVTVASKEIFFTPEISPLHALEQTIAHHIHSYKKFFKPTIAAKDQWQIFTCTVKDTNLFAAHGDSYGKGLGLGYYFTWPYKMENNGNWRLIDTISINVMDKKTPVLHTGLSISSGELWLSKRVGIVKFKPYTKQVWELKEYYINP